MPITLRINIKTMRPVFIMSVLAVLLCGCLTVYKAEIQQGNVVTQEMIDKLKPGMTRSQVKFVLGTPLVTDLFHPMRWDYYYYLRPANTKTAEAQRLTVIFKNDLLTTVHEDALTKPAPAAPDDSNTRPTTDKPAPATGAGYRPDDVRFRAL